MPSLRFQSELPPIAVAALTAFVIVAVFAWTERTELVDPEGLSASSWAWRLWQIPPLLIGCAGVWWIWSASTREAWIRGLALVLLAVTVFVNAYTGWFGEHGGNVWLTVNPLFIACASVAALSLWHLDSVAGRAGAALSAGLGGVVFANGYFVDEVVIWQILNPLMMLVTLSWAAGADRVSVSASENSEPG
ncbi:MAG: hypothetical protein OXD50_16825 [Chloroflexi bacterium]|nr:hypothetical protein [Chloroflexota bacterium]